MRYKTKVKRFLLCCSLKKARKKETTNVVIMVDLSHEIC